MSVNLDMNLNGGGNKNDPNFEFIWEQYEKQARELKEYNDKSMEICPLPGLVIKTWLQSIEANPESGEPAVSFPDNEEGAKVFINVCHHKSIGAPEQIETEEGDTQLRIPLSCGPIRLDKDKENKPCVVVDVVINPLTLEQCSQDKEYRNLVGTFAMSKVQQKNHMVFQQRCKFPKTQYKGVLPPAPQRIRKSGAYVPPLVEEVNNDTDDRNTSSNINSGRETSASSPSSSSSSSSSSLLPKPSHSTPTASSSSPTPSVAASTTDLSMSDAGNDVKSNAQANLNTSTNPSDSAVSTSLSHASLLSNLPAVCPESEIQCVFDGEKVFYNNKLAKRYQDDGDDIKLPDTIIAYIYLPFVSHVEEIDLECSHLDLELNTVPSHKDKHQYSLHLDFPFVVDEGQVKAKFEKKKKRLRLKFPVTGEKVDDSNVDFKHELNLSNKLMFTLCN